MDRYTVGSFLGSGAYAEVYSATDSVTQRTVAVKKIQLDNNKELSLSMLRESLILYELQHENIVRLECVYMHEHALYLVLEQMSWNMREHQALYPDMYEKDLKMVKGFLKQILCGISYCHGRGVIHHDLKPDNLLISGDVLKIADFGSARGFLTCEARLSPKVVTVEYRAPEILLGSNQYSTTVDMWSIGCIFAEMVNLKVLFDAKTELEVLKEIFRNMGTPKEDSWVGVTKLPNFPNWTDCEPQDLGSLVPRLDEDGQDLLMRLLSLDPSKRISAKDALEHNFLVA